eukprot:m.300172 g.300172  ORF g.300172 m.300172 type:complete len:373 (+) comp15874_c0_seq40:133-1251(+)
MTVAVMTPQPKLRRATAWLTYMLLIAYVLGAFIYSRQGVNVTTKAKQSNSWVGLAGLTIWFGMTVLSYWLVSLSNPGSIDSTREGVYNATSNELAIPLVSTSAGAIGTNGNDRHGGGDDDSFVDAGESHKGWETSDDFIEPKPTDELIVDDSLQSDPLIPSSQATSCGDGDSSRNALTQSHTFTAGTTKAMLAHYCPYCRMHKPLRTKHCKECQRCCRRHDHHCAIIANCVGEKNHALFYATLWLHETVALYMFRFIFREFSKHDSTAWILLVLALVVLGFGILVLTMLVAIHSYVIVSGVTTWESLSRRRISYLKDLTPSASPFDQGCLKNTWWFFVLSYRNPTDWKQVYNGPENSCACICYVLPDSALLT